LVEAVSELGSALSPEVLEAWDAEMGALALKAVPADIACTDLGNGAAFAALHLGRFRYVPAEGVWLRWSGGRWRRDEELAALRAAGEVARELLRQAADKRDSTEMKRATAWAMRSMSETRLRAMLKLAGAHETIVTTPDRLDADPWLLSCGNGTLDLRTGELRPGDPADLITLGTEVPYDPEATCRRWQQFLVEVFDGDGELVRFVQRAVGYSLTGVVREHVAFVGHGSGRNGKTVFREAIQALVGGCAKATPFDTFMRTRADKATRNDIAALHRARLVVASESGEGRKLDEATVKTVTGGDTIAARFLFKEFFEFRPGFKVWLFTNYRPRVAGDDEAIWARLRLIPFTVSFRGREDVELGATLAGELPGILAWAFQGCRDWQQHGLGTAQAVERATAEYRREEDTLGAFLDECCNLKGEVQAAELREAYEKFCRDLDEEPLEAAQFGKKLHRRGIVRGGSARARVYRGVSLR
jgi:putative DNA primase/helicase